MPFQNTLSYAKELDRIDPLQKFRDRFYFPQLNGKNVIYFTGNSLGLQPNNAKDFVDEVMEDWPWKVIFIQRSHGGTTTKDWQNH